MKRCMTSLMDGGTTTKTTQHVAGRLLLHAKLWGADYIPQKDMHLINNYDEVMLFQTPEALAGYDKISLYGGMEPHREKYERMVAIMEAYQGEIYQTVGAYKYATAISARGVHMSERFDNLTVRTFDEMVGMPAVIGDSHAPGITKDGWRCYNYDGKTLFSTLKAGLESLLPDDSTPLIAFNFGNIDIRHHICRQDDAIAATLKLVHEYVKQAKALKSKVWLTKLLPNTPDERVIPNSGKYKGTTYYGDLELRDACVEVFNNYLTNNFTDLIGWNYTYYDDNGHLPASVMEKPRSVHLAPTHYNLNWN